MTAQELLKQFDPSAALPVYLICPGKANPRARENSFEPLIADQVIQKIVDALVEPSLRDLAYNAYYADDTDPGEVVSVANTLPFLSERRVIVVRGVESYESETAMARLLPYLADPCESTVLVLVANQVDQRRKLFKTCEKGGFVVPCPQLSEPDVRQWITNAAKGMGKDIEPDAVVEVIARSGFHLSDVANAVRIVTEFVGPEVERIKQEHVVTACADVAEDQIWSLTDAIADSDVKKALVVLRELMAMGKSEFEVLGSINWLLKTAYDVAVTPPNHPRMKGYAQRKCVPLAKKFGAAKIGDAFALITETDFMLRSTGTEKLLMIELLVVKLAAPRAAWRSTA